jgi:exonuclease III
MYVIAWNVNGYSDKIHSYLDTLLTTDEPDVVFLSETKKSKEKLLVLNFVNYNVIINSHDPWRYHGVMMLVHKKHAYMAIDVNLNISCRSDSKGYFLFKRVAT